MNGCVLLGKVSESARLFRKNKFPLVFFERVSVGFLKAAEPENLAFHLVCLFFIHPVNQWLNSRFQHYRNCFYPIVHTHMLRLVFWRSRPRYHHMVTQLQNASLLVNIYRCRSFITPTCSSALLALFLLISLSADLPDNPSPLCSANAWGHVA